VVPKNQSKKAKYEESLVAFQKALELFRKEDFTQAAKLFQEFIHKYNEEKEFVDRARIYLTICENRLHPPQVNLENFDDYYHYSVYLINRGDYEEALEYLKKANQEKPKEGKIYYLMADAFCLLGNYDECLKNLKKAIQLDDFFRILAQNERDFESLWEDKKFKLILRLA